MSRRHWLGAAAALAAVVGGLFAWDALVVTDEERLEGLVSNVTGRVSGQRTSAAIDRWVDLDRQPLEVSAMGESLHFSAGEDAALAERAGRAVRELRGVTLRAMQTAIVVEGDEATVRLRLFSRERGMSRVEWRLIRHDEDWLVERFALTR